MRMTVEGSFFFYCRTPPSSSSVDDENEKKLWLRPRARGNLLARVCYANEHGKSNEGREGDKKRETESSPEDEEWQRLILLYIGSFQLVERFRCRVPRDD